MASATVENNTPVNISSQSRKRKREMSEINCKRVKMWDTLVDKLAPRSKKQKKVSIQDRMRQVHIIPRMHEPVYLFDKIVQTPIFFPLNVKAVVSAVVSNEPTATYLPEPHPSVEKPRGVATDGGSIFMSKHYVLTLRKEMENNLSSHYINRVFINAATLP